MSKVKIETIKQWLTDEDCDVRNAAMNACNGRTDIPVEVIKQGLTDEDWRVRNAAMNACNGRTDIPVEVIKQGLTDEDCDVRNAAMNACNGRTDIPVEVIKQGLTDEDWRVRNAAMKWFHKNGIELPVIRTIEPPAKVFKKCVNNVIVVAEIPHDAQVRGSMLGKCRANKATIVDVIGEYGGVNVGISIYDKVTAYYVGDIVEVEDFDMGCEECSTGFHFFCERELAEAY